MQDMSPLAMCTALQLVNLTVADVVGEVQVAQLRLSLPHASISVQSHQSSDDIRF